MARHLAAPAHRADFRPTLSLVSAPAGRHRAPTTTATTSWSRPFIVLTVILLVVLAPVMNARRATASTVTAPSGRPTAYSLMHETCHRTGMTTATCYRGVDEGNGVSAWFTRTTRNGRTTSDGYAQWAALDGSSRAPIAYDAAGRTIALLYRAR